MLYAIHFELTRNGKLQVNTTFYSDWETAKLRFEDLMQQKLSHEHSATLYQIDMKGRGFTDLNAIPFEKYSEIAHFHHVNDLNRV